MQHLEASIRTATLLGPLDPLAGRPPWLSGFDGTHHHMSRHVCILVFLLLICHTLDLSKQPCLWPDRVNFSIL